MEPVQGALDEVKEKLTETIEPSRLLQPLEAPFTEMLGLFDQVDPHALVAPLQEKLSAGIDTLINALPLDAANEAFDHVATFTDMLHDAVAYRRLPT